MLKPIDYEKHFVIGTPLVAWNCDRNERTDCKLILSQVAQLPKHL
jgi:hypothetical protein